MLIRDKIILIFTGIVICILSLFSFYVYYFYSIYREQEFQVRLNNKARIFANVLISRDRLHDNLFKSIAKTDLLTLVDEKVLFMNEKKNIVYSNRETTDTAFYRQLTEKFEPDSTLSYDRDKSEGTGIIYLTQEGDTYYVFASGYDVLGGTKLNILKMILVVGNLMGCIVTVISAYFFSGRLIKPIKKMVLDVNAISEKNLDKSIDEGNGNDEFAMLSMTFNRMLFRLRKAFDAQKSFIAHSSHQLRTPLTNLLGTMQTSLAYDKSFPEMRASMESGVEELKYLIELTNNLLALTKAEEVSISLKEDDLDLIVLQAREQALKKFSGRKVICDISQSENIESSYPINCNKSLMATAIYNILDNALKYSDGEVKVKLERHEKNYIVTVTDKGPGIPEKDISRVFGPLVRGTNIKHVPGFGIGLALTEKIVHLHGGTVQLRNLDKHGLEAEIVLQA